MHIGRKDRMKDTLFISFGVGCSVKSSCVDGYFEPENDGLASNNPLAPGLCLTHSGGLHGG